MYSYPHKTAYRRFDPPVDMAPYLKKAEGRKASLYFHIPFCRYKCGFCNLFSLQSCNTAMADAYLDAMSRQAGRLSSLAKALQFDAFAIGGGTPLLLSVAQLNKLFDTAALFGVAANEVFTSVETSPDYAGGEVLRFLKDKGVERISIGIQSFHTEELLRIKRRTSVSAIETALGNIRQMKFPQFNIDLIYGIEGQTTESFLSSVRNALRWQPTELFLYPLYIRNGVRIAGKVNSERLFDMYTAGRDELLKSGFRQTSMRRFVQGNEEAAAPEYSCGDEVMISCGCGGRSYIGELHCATPYAVGQSKIKSIIDAYIATTNFTTATNGYLLSEEEQRRRYLIKNLMYYRGIDKAGYAQRFGECIPDAPFNTLIDEGLAEDKDGFIRLTAEGMACSDEIGPLFISPAVRKQTDDYRLE
jgi:oxygen-independent coproporphyrinogen-3 oxidase